MDAAETAEVRNVLVTPEMTEQLGAWHAGETSPRIADADIRRWSIAVYWPEPPPAVFWDAALAGSTRWGGIVAPEDSNPFAWPVDRRGAGSTAGAMDEFGLPTPTRRRDGPATSEPSIGGMNAGREDFFHARMRPGDAISSRSRLAGWEVKTTRFGPSLFATIESEWHNQHGELVRLRRQSTLRYLLGLDRPRSETPPVRPHALQSTFPSWTRITHLEHWNRYAAVNDEFVDMHMDDQAGIRAGNPAGAFGMGNLRYAYVLNALRAWFGHDAAIRRIRCEFRALNQKGDELIVCGAVTSESQTETGTTTEILLDVANQDGLSTCPASATVEVPHD